MVLSLFSTYTVSSLDSTITLLLIHYFRSKSLLAMPMWLEFNFLKWKVVQARGRPQQANEVPLSVKFVKFMRYHRRWECIFPPKGMNSRSRHWVRMVLWKFLDLKSSKMWANIWRACVCFAINASVRNYLPHKPQGPSPKNAPRWALAVNFDKKGTKFVE